MQVSPFLFLLNFNDLLLFLLFWSPHYLEKIEKKILKNLVCLFSFQYDHSYSLFSIKRDSTHHLYSLSDLISQELWVNFWNLWITCNVSFFRSLDHSWLWLLACLWIAIWGCGLEFSVIIVLYRTRLSWVIPCFLCLKKDYKECWN